MWSNRHPGIAKHIDGGLSNAMNAGHVLAATQALLHSNPMIEFLLGDSDHRSSCRSLLCLVCSLYKLYTDMAQAGVGNPTTLVLKWNDVSKTMTQKDQCSPLKVLEVFIDKLRFEQLNRNNEFELLYLSPLSIIWKSIIKYQVTCSCGQYDDHKEMASLLLESVVDDLSSCIEKELAQTKTDICSQCTHSSAVWTPLSITRLAQCLVVHISESLISEPSETENAKFIAMCPDGRCRQFDDAKVVPLSLISLYMSDFITKSGLTMIYEKRKEATEEVNKKRYLKTNNSSLPGKVSSKLERINLSEDEEKVDDPSGQETGDSSHADNATHADKATQTSTAETVDTGIQTLPYYTFETCRYSKKFKLYTGVSVEDFEVLYNFIGGFPVISKLQFKYAIRERLRLRPSKISCRDKLFMFLLRFRRGLPLEELSEIFQCSVSWAGEICYAMTRLLYLSFKEIEQEMFPTAQEQAKTRPEKMKPFENLRVLLDGVSFYIQTPSNFEQQGNSFSKYKSHNVVVFTVGISCNGATIFCSEGMEGNMSDKQVVLHSDLLSRLSPGDGVMSDRGYELAAELEEIGCAFFKPPSKSANNVFIAEEEILTKAIASARIYTEHAMADIKDNRLLQGVIPLNMLPVLSDLVYIGAYLRNFSTSRIRNKTFRSSNPATDDPVNCKERCNPDDPDEIVV